VIGDVCLCEYTDHGHCGVIEESAETDPTLTVKNDETLELLAETAVSQADAGADMVAPSAMTDGQVRAIREALDAAGHADVGLMSYAVKYESAFTGPSATRPTVRPRSATVATTKWTPRTVARRSARLESTPRRARTC